jgi:glycosyltransferase involved in cell wall biosynthesis
MKQVYYVGFYDTSKCKKRKQTSSNIAASMKMDFIIQCLKELGYKVIIVSLSVNKTPGLYKMEHVIVDEKEEYYYLPYISLPIWKSDFIARKTALISLRLFGLCKFHKHDIVINYHSLAYGLFFRRLKALKNFRWIPQIEELYCLSRKDYQDINYLAEEEEMFSGADGYLFVNDLLPNRYANGKPYAISYGNYKIFCDNKERNNSNIGVVYTGIINEDRGVFQIIEAIPLLPDKYSLHILGFGDDVNMKRMYKLIEKTNNDSPKKRIFFYGTKTGGDYTQFLASYQIGVSLMDTSDDISLNAFPSKILAYMGHSLYVVSSKSECIMKSKVSDLLYFCDNTPDSIAATIQQIDVEKDNMSTNRLELMKQEFSDDLKKVVEG